MLSNTDCDVQILLSLQSFRRKEVCLSSCFAFQSRHVTNNHLFFNGSPMDSHCVGAAKLELPIMAEAFGGLLTVYSTKE